MTDRRATSGDEVGVDPPFGSFHYQPAKAQLTWSDGMFRLFGFGAGEIVPTLAVMSSHQHPEDRASWDRGVAGILADGQPVSQWHRLVDTASRVHTVQTAIQADLADGEVVALRGISSDLTERLRQLQVQESTQAVARSAATRSVIDQAKGMLMATMDLDEDQAFELLRWHSSYANIKLRDIAASLIRKLAETDPAGTPPRQRLTAILAELAGNRMPSLPTGPSIRRTTNPLPPADQVAAVASRIPVSLLPRTLVRAVAAAAISITIADSLAEDWPLVYVNAAFEKLTGYPAAEILGRNCRFLQGPDTDPGHTAGIRSALINGEEIRTVLRNHRRDGTPFWNEMHLSAVRDAAGRITHYIGYQSDVSERVEREQQIEHLAYHDAATSLPNQAAALKHLQETIDTADDSTAFTVLHIRIAGFRPTDESEAIETIRDVLTTAATRLAEALPVPTFLAKLDDDSFVAVITNEPPGPAREAVIRAFDSALATAQGDRRVTVSVGLAGYPGDSAEAQGLIDFAYDALG